VTWLWIPITIAAALLQNIRTALQKHLKGRLSTNAATYTRYVFGFPLAILYLVALNRGFGLPLPTFNWDFAAWMAAGAVTQIVATSLLLHAFTYKNFAVGVAYSKTEVIQAAVFGLVFLGETVTPRVLAAIAIGVLGVVLISVARVELTARGILASLSGRVAVIGIASGAMFAASAVSYRAASLALAGPNFMMQAAYTLAWTTLFQTILMLGWMLWRDRAELVRVARAWKWSLAAGVAGGTASFGWFMAMTIQQAALVRSLAQIEMLFTFATTVFVFKEKISRLEVAGCLLIVAGIVVLLMQR